MGRETEYFFIRVIYTFGGEHETQTSYPESKTPTFNAP